MRSGWLDVVTGLEFGKPGIRLGAGHMQASALKMLPGVERFLAEGLALLLARHVLLDSLAHQPVQRAAALIGQAANARLEGFIKTNRNRGRSHE